MSEKLEQKGGALDVRLGVPLLFGALFELIGESSNFFEISVF